MRAAEEELQAVDNLDLVYAEEGEYPFVFRRGKFLIAVNPRSEGASAQIAAKGNYRLRESIGTAQFENGELTMDGLSLAVFEEV